MVTILDVALTEHFTVIFAIIFIIAVIFGVLEMTKIFGKNRGLNALVAFLMGLIAMLVPDVSRLVTSMVPWFTLFFIFIIFVLIAYKMFGASEADLVAAMKDRAVMWAILIICIIIVIAAFGSVYGQRFIPVTQGQAAAVQIGTGTTGSTSFSSNMAATFFHPKILGFILLMLIAVFTIAILAGDYSR